MGNIKYLVSTLIALLTAAYFYLGVDQGTSTHVLEKPPVESTKPQWDNVVDYAREHLPMEGNLRVNAKGFAYLKVDDGYIQQLFPKLGLKEKGFRQPPYYRSADSPGAHISVFYVDEKISPSEIGQTFHFNLKDITIVKTRNAKYVVLQVESPELENLRKKYGLSPKLYGHDFHISLGKKEYHHSKH